MVATPAASGLALRCARAVAEAVLYEGYLLYPYRRSSAKNQVRWQFGVLLPPAWARERGLDDTSVAGSAESWWQQTECLAEAGPAAEAVICVRFLQVQQRSVEERLPGGSYRPVPELTVAGQPELSFDEAVPREYTTGVRLADLLAGERRVRLRAPAGAEITMLAGADGPAGRVVRRRRPVTATAVLTAAACGPAPGLVKLRVRIENTGTAAVQAPREEALRVSLVACHLLLAIRGGSFVSLLDPPQAALAAARDCVNVHTFPVLAGPPGQRGVMLSSPIIMYDHPQIAPESPGDLHDATEIDEILSLRALTLTEAEQREARATDQRAAAILDRVGAMPPAVLARLHGTIRSPGPDGLSPDQQERRGHRRQPRERNRHRPGEPGPPPGPGGPPPGPGGPPPGEHGPGGDRPAVPWWDLGADAAVCPETDSVLAGGVRLARGSLVRLRPRRRGTDPQDMFLDGRPAQVEAVLLGVDGSRQLAVTLTEDPGADLNRWYGRYRYFRPDEVEPLPGPGEHQ